MKRKVYLYGLKVFANFVLILAYMSITQCCIAIMYQIPMDNQLKQKIKESRQEIIQERG